MTTIAMYQFFPKQNVYLRRKNKVRLKFFAKSHFILKKLTTFAFRISIS